MLSEVWIYLARLPLITLKKGQGLVPGKAGMGLVFLTRFYSDYCTKKPFPSVLTRKYAESFIFVFLTNLIVKPSPFP
jgi:hypothetical protein